MIETNKTLVQFQLCTEKTKLGTPDAGTIVFIQDTKELYLDGNCYGLSAADAEALSTATSNISTLTTNFNAHLQLTNGLVDYVKNLRKFADGATDNNLEGPVLITRDSGVLQGKDNVKAAINALAEAVDTLKAHVWNAVTKPGDAGQFATSVTQETDGAIKVTYKDVESTDVKRTEEQQRNLAGATVEDALGTLNTNLNATNQNVSANTSAIEKINGPENETGSIANAVKVAKEALIGEGEGVWAEGELKTLTKLRDLIKANAAKISTLQGIDDGTAERLEAIVNELKTAGENGEFAGTLLDKFLTLYGTPTDGKFTVVDGNPQTTLQGIIDAIETRITNVNTALSGSLTSTIEGLDATVRGQLTEADAVEDTKHVGVKVVETDGKLISVTVVEDNIANKSDLTALSQEVSGIKTTVENQGNQLTWKVIS